MDAEEPELAGVELEMSGYEQAQYDKIWALFSHFLGRGGGATSVEGKKPAVESAGKRDMAAHRLLSLGSFDIRLVSLIADKRTHGAVQAQEWVDTTHDHGFSEYFYSTRPTPTVPSYVDRIGVCRRPVDPTPVPSPQLPVAPTPVRPWQGTLAVGYLKFGKEKMIYALTLIARNLPWNYPVSYVYMAEARNQTASRSVSTPRLNAKNPRISETFYGIEVGQQIADWGMRIASLRGVPFLPGSVPSNPTENAPTARQNPIPNPSEPVQFAWSMVQKYVEQTNCGKDEPLCSDHGFAEYFRATCLDHKAPPYTERLQSAEYQASCSPKLRYVCGIFDSCFFDDKDMAQKVILFVMWPIEQHAAGMFLHSLGVSFLYLWPDMAPAVRSRTIINFQDADHPSQVLICSMKGSAYGLNLQKCARMLVMSLPENIHHLMQRLGGSTALGRTKSNAFG
jgi:hypothetical protein